MAEGGEALGEGDRRQGGGVVEGVGVDRGEALGKGDRHQGGGAVEGLVLNGGEALLEGDRHQGEVAPRKARLPMELRLAGNETDAKERWHCRRPRSRWR